MEEKGHGEIVQGHGQRSQQCQKEKHQRWEEWRIRTVAGLVGGGGKAWVRHIGVARPTDRGAFGRVECEIITVCEKGANEERPQKLAKGEMDKAAY